MVTIVAAINIINNTNSIATIVIGAMATRQGQLCTSGILSSTRATHSPVIT